MWREVTYARTSTVLFMANGLQMTDLLLSGVLPRFPELKFISVESGIGWVPFCLESCDYHFLAADIRKARPEFEMMPSDYFRRQVYACYWFEKIAPRKLIEDIGEDNILFETDFPHPTCLYGNVQETIEAASEKSPRRFLENRPAHNIDIPSHSEGLAAAPSRALEIAAPRRKLGRPFAPAPPTAYLRSAGACPRLERGYLPESSANTNTRPGCSEIAAASAAMTEF